MSARTFVILFVVGMLIAAALQAWWWAVVVIGIALGAPHAVRAFRVEYDRYNFASYRHPPHE